MKRAVTEAEFEKAFSKLMCPLRARQCAELLCRPPEPVDDAEKQTWNEDHTVFDPKRFSSLAEQHVYYTYHEDTRMLRLEGDMAYYRWVKDMIRKLDPSIDVNSFYALLNKKPTRPYMEIFVLVCAIRMAFPRDAWRLIKTYVRDNRLYKPFWDGALPHIWTMLPTAPYPAIISRLEIAKRQLSLYAEKVEILAYEIGRKIESIRRKSS